MLRHREPVNIWPGFVDLFSNLTIVLLFLLIVFVVMSSSAKFLLKESGPGVDASKDEKIRELSERIVNQDSILERFVQNRAQLEDEANELLLQKALIAEAVARMEVEAADAEIEARAKEGLILQQTRELSQQAAEMARMQAANADLERQHTELQSLKDEAMVSDVERRRLLSELENLKGTLRTETEATTIAKEVTAAQLRTLTREIANLSNALAVSEERAAEREVQYIELSTRFNRALADKLAEVGDMREYQSMFFSAVRRSLGDTGMVQMDDDRFTLPSDILFAQGSYAISASGKRQLKNIADVIKEIYTMIPNNVSWIIRVDGHTDNIPVRPGSELRDNTQLSLLRARAVTEELVKNGIDRRLLAPTGFGETHPVAIGNRPEDLQRNRRIELRLTNP
ncbi:MAG: OmpA family protein [Alphaproteobacteria bacterium]|nr:OmpA family protein [Alphaproteobacteria bacterium]